MPRSHTLASHSDWRAGIRDPVNHVIVLLALAFAVGGGGVAQGFNNLAVQLAALVLIGVHRVAFARFWVAAPRALNVLIAATIALPLLHALSLPPALWQSLPGRELAQEALALVGRDEAWFPFSLDRARSLTAAISLLPPLAIVALSWRMDEAQQSRLVLALIAIAVAAVLLAGVQVATAGRLGQLYDEVPARLVTGPFANRNSFALFLAAGLALVLLGNHTLPFGRLGQAGVAAILLLGCLLSQSRSGMALAMLVLLLFAVREIVTREKSASRRGYAILAAIAVTIAAGGLAATNQRLSATFDRFDELESTRAEIWEDGKFVAARYWPAGSGMGTFDEVFQVDETFDYLVPDRAGRAHNDYLELAIEAGAVGLALLAAWIVWLLGAAARLPRRAAASTARAAMTILALIALQSIVDFPLRNQAMLCLAGLMIGLVASAIRTRIADPPEA